jgi:hypothetical protein
MSNTELTTNFNHVGNFLVANADSAASKAGSFLFDAFGSLSLTLTAACVLIGATASLAAPNMEVVEFWLNAVSAGY